MSSRGREKTEQQVWAANAAAADAARALVAEQAGDLLRMSNMTGSGAAFGQRVRAVVAATGAEDMEALRGAVMEAGVAAMAWCVAIDVALPAAGGRPRAQVRSAGETG